MKKRKLFFIFIPIILFIMLAICVNAGLSVNFEGWAYNEATEKMSPLITTFMKLTTHTGDAAVVILFCLFLFLIERARKAISIPVSITVISAATLNFILKNAFARERPDILRLINETDYSFPSGHAMNNAALYTILTILTFKYIKSKPKRITLTIISVYLVLAIGFSRLYLGVHYAGDVIGGWLLGFLVALVVYYWWSARVTKKTGNDV